jgi:PAS domain S-box-containing protein
MTDQPDMILIVEDEDDHFELIRREFGKGAGGRSLERARDLREARRLIASRRPALVIADWKLPDGDGVQLIAKCPSGASQYPVIVMTSHGNEAWAVEAMKLGALDYIVKSPEAFADIPRIVNRACSEWKNIVERRSAENALQEEKELTETAVNTMPGVFFVLDAEGRYVRWNRCLEDLLGSADGSLRGRAFLDAVHSSDRQAVARTMTEVLAAGYAETGARLLAGGSTAARDHFLTFRKMYNGGRSYLVGSGLDVTERKQAEDAVRQSREHISLILNSTAEGIYGIDRDGLCTFCNASGLRMLGYASEDELLGRNIHETIHHAREDGTHYPQADCASRRVLTSGGSLHADREYLWRRDGTGFPVEFWAHPLIVEGRAAGSVCTFIDITERTTLENQLRQSQKMEAIGVLAGGVAHDFNNILTAIIGYSNIVCRKMDPADPSRPFLDQILSASGRAASLTQSLLAFSRKQAHHPRNTDLNDTIRRVERLLCRIIGEDIALTTSLAGESMTVYVDAMQIEQVLMNLATNARDAMPRGGRLVIRTGIAEVSAAEAGAKGLGRPASYATLTVSDTGSGIEEGVREKIFEPFFTTKEAGKGTGLGLSMVYGIVKQNGGHIALSSTPGKGSAFTIYLPLVACGAAGVAVDPSEPVRGGTETVLVAEDDRVVRTITREVLSEFCYRVIEAENGEDAVNKFLFHRGGIDLAILDVIMPKKSGREVYEEARKHLPGLKVLFTSGYPADLIRKEGVIDGSMPFLPKPSTPREVLKKVREVLDQKT